MFCPTHCDIIQIKVASKEISKMYELHDHINYNHISKSIHFIA